MPPCNCSFKAVKASALELQTPRSSARQGIQSSPSPQAKKALLILVLGVRHNLASNHHQAACWFRRNWVSLFRMCSSAAFCFKSFVEKTATEPMKLYRLYCSCQQKVQVELGEGRCSPASGMPMVLSAKFKSFRTSRISLRSRSQLIFHLSFPDPCDLRAANGCIRSQRAVPGRGLTHRSSVVPLRSSEMIPLCSDFAVCCTIFSDLCQQGE